MDINEIVNKAFESFGNDEGYIVVYTVEAIYLGRVKDKNATFTSPFAGYDKLRELRIFNNDKEVKIVYNDEDKSYVGPIITTDEGETFDEYLSLGEARASENGNTLAGRDGEKKMLWYPLSFARTGYLQVRNYIEYDVDDIAYIKKSRYVKFVDNKEGK